MTVSLSLANYLIILLFNRNKIVLRPLASASKIFKHNENETSQPNHTSSMCMRMVHMSTYFLFSWEMDVDFSKKIQWLPSHDFRLSTLPYEQLLQGLIEHHHAGSVRQRRFGSRDWGRFGWRWISNNLPLGLRGGLFALNTMWETKFEDLLSELVHNLTREKNNAAHHTLGTHVGVKQCTTLAPIHLVEILFILSHASEKRDGYC